VVIGAGQSRAYTTNIFTFGFVVHVVFSFRSITRRGAENKYSKTLNNRTY